MCTNSEGCRNVRLCHGYRRPGPPAAQNTGNGISLARLIAHPSSYHGKVVRVTVNVTTGFENITAYPSSEKLTPKNYLWLEIDDGAFDTDADFIRYESTKRTWQRFDRQTVSMRATFEKNKKG